MFHLLTGQRYNINLNFWFIVTNQVTKQIWFNFSKTFSRLIGWIFKDISESCVFAGILQNIWRNLHFSNRRNVILMTTSSVVTIWYSHLPVLISELIQSKSAMKTQSFRATKISADFLWNSAEFFSSEQRWFKENQSWSALMFFMFSASALKNVKCLKQRCSALIISGTSSQASEARLTF